MPAPATEQENGKALMENGEVLGPPVDDYDMVQNNALRSFVKDELQHLSKTLALQIQNFREECLAKQDHTAQILEGWGSRPKAHVENSLSGNHQSLGADHTSLQVSNDNVLEEHAPANDQQRVRNLDNPVNLSSQNQSGNECAEHEDHLAFHHRTHHRSFQDAEKMDDEDQRDLYDRIIQRSLRSGFWRGIFEMIGKPDWLPQDMPDTAIARSTDHVAFTTLTTLLILGNTCIMGFETNASIRAVLQIPRGSTPSWIKGCNSIFNFVFAVELIYRMVALRSWFWMCPSWGWNFFDFFVVVTSLVSDAVEGMNFTFIRMFRILRAVRVVRLIRVLRFFRELRKMLFAILACLASLVWTFVFLALTIFIFSILLLQGVTTALDDMDESSEEYLHARREVMEWYPSLSDTMFSLLAAATGGQDWLEVRRPLSHAGFLYTSAFLLYIIFVTVGVMNVLTGVFLGSANEFQDHSQIVQNQEIKTENFVRDMLELFKEMDIAHTGVVDQESFWTCMQNETLQAYFAAHDLEPTHARLLFDLLADGSGKLDVTRMVMGTLRLKGEAKAIDTRILRRMLEELQHEFGKRFPALTLI